MIKILAIDDNNDNLITLGAIIKDSFPDAIFYKAISGKKGIELAIYRDPDVILLDIIMPDMNGFEVCRQLKKDERVCDIPVVFLTAMKEDREKRIKAIEVGGEAFLHKPIDEAELVAQIRVMVKIREFNSQKRNENKRLTQLVAERTHELEQSHAETVELLHKLKVENEKFKNTEEELKESEEKFRLLHEYAGVGIGCYTPEGIVISFNKIAALNMNGNPEDFSGKSIYTLFSKEDADFYMNRIGKAVKSEIGQEYEDKVDLPTGEKWFQSVFTRIFDSSNQVFGVQIISTDITERKKVEERIKLDEARLESLLQINQHPAETIQELLDFTLNEAILLTESRIGYIYFYDENKKELTLNSWSKEVMQLCSVTEPQTVYSLEKTGFWGEAVRQRQPVLINDFAEFNPMKKGIPEGHAALHKFLTIPVFSAGHIVAVVGVANKLSDYNDSDIRQLNLMMDSVWKIVQRKRAESDITASEARLKRAELTSSLGNWEYYLETQKVFASEGAMNLYGFNKSILDYDEIKVIPLIEYRQMMDDALLNLVKFDVPYDIEFKIGTADTGVIKDIHSLAVFDSDKKIVFGIIQDITERKSAEAKLKESETKFRMLFTQMSEGFALHELIYDEALNPVDYKILDINPAFETQVGIQAEKAIGSLATELYGVTPAPFIDLYSRVAESGEHQIFQSYFPPLDRHFQISVFSPNTGYFATVFTDITERVKGEEALTNSNELLSRFILHSSIYTYIKEVTPNESRVLKASENFIDMIGISGSQMVGKNMYELFPPEFAGKITADDWEVASNDHLIQLDEELNGRYYFTIKHPIKQGNKTLLAGYTIDITERKKAEEALRETKNYLENLLNYANAPIIVWDNNFLITQFNKAFERLSGRMESEVLGKPVEILFPAETRDQSIGYIKKTSVGERWEVVEIEIQDMEGYVHTLLWNSAAIYSQDGKTVLATIAQGQDITKRKQAEEEKKRTQKLLEDSQRIGKIGGWEMNLDTLGLNWTNEMYNIHEVDLAYIPKVDDRDKFYTPESVPIIDKAVNDAIEHGGSYDVDLEIITAKGNRRSIKTIGKADLKSRRVFGFFQDITERKLAEVALKENERRLQELNATKDKFFSIIAHDLKSPFNSILGLSNMLVEQIQDKNYEAIEEYADIIQKSSLQAVDLLMNLLEWSRLQTGRMEFSPEYIEMVDLINDIIELFNFSAQQKSIEVVTEMPRNLLVFADKAMISTVLRNLISNSIKFTNIGGQIVISAEVKLGTVLISVRDNGVGIKNERIEKLFRIDENHSTLGTQNENGTGLGLILCKEFVEKHSGKIWIESEMSKGSKFCFTIPKN